MPGIFSRIGSLLGLKAATEKKKMQISLKPIAEKIVVAIAGRKEKKAIEYIVSRVSKNSTAAFIIIAHFDENFTEFAKKLDSTAQIIVKEANDGEPLKEGVAYIAPRGSHIRVSFGKQIILSSEAPIEGLRPNGDELLESAVQAFGGNILGVQLSGEGSDGKRGMALVKINGGRVICQDEGTSNNFSMPRSVIVSGNADFVLPLEKIAGKIEELIE